MSNIPGSDAVRLRHMLDAAHKARQFTLEREQSDLESDEMLALALVRLLEIVGEAATHVSQGVRIAYPQIPWQCQERERMSADRRFRMGSFGILMID